MKKSTTRDSHKTKLTYASELIEAVKDAATASDLKAWRVIENAVARALKWKK